MNNNSNYDSVYSISLEILKLIEAGSGGSGLTEEQVRNIIEAYNYITMADVEGRNYTTMAEVEAKGYTTMSDVDGKNYTTMTEVESKGYITSAALPKEWYGTQAEYDAIANKDANTTYFIYE